MQKSATLTLLARAYCHLCDDMHAAVAPIAKRYGAELVVVDVDAAESLERRYGDLVPVLLLGPADSGVPLCHYRLDGEAVKRALEDS